MTMLFPALKKGKIRLGQSGFRFYTPVTAPAQLPKEPLLLPEEKEEKKGSKKDDDGIKPSDFQNPFKDVKGFSIDVQKLQDRYFKLYKELSLMPADQLAAVKPYYVTEMNNILSEAIVLGNYQQEGDKAMEFLKNTSGGSELANDASGNVYVKEVERDTEGKITKELGVRLISKKELLTTEGKLKYVGLTANQLYPIRDREIHLGNELFDGMYNTVGEKEYTEVIKSMGERNKANVTKRFFLPYIDNNLIGGTYALGLPRDEQVTSNLNKFIESSKTLMTHLPVPVVHYLRTKATEILSSGQLTDFLSDKELQRYGVAEVSDETDKNILKNSLLFKKGNSTFFIKNDSLDSLIDYTAYKIARQDYMNMAEHSTSESIMNYNDFKGYFGNKDEITALNKTDSFIAGLQPGGIYRESDGELVDVTGVDMEKTSLKIPGVTGTEDKSAVKYTPTIEEQYKPYMKTPFTPINKPIIINGVEFKSDASKTGDFFTQLGAIHYQTNPVFYEVGVPDGYELDKDGNKVVKMKREVYQEGYMLVGEENASLLSASGFFDKNGKKIDTVSKDNVVDRDDWWSFSNNFSNLSMLTTSQTEAVEREKMVQAINKAWGDAVYLVKYYYKIDPTTVADINKSSVTATQNIMEADYKNQKETVEKSKQAEDKLGSIGNSSRKGADKEQE